MKEIVFIKQNLAKWKNVEQRLDNIQAESPESLSNLYFDITSDLSFAQTNYPSSPITNYLNDIALTLHINIYSSKQESWRRLITFWTQEVPDTVYKTRYYHLLSLIILAVSMLIGIVSTIGDPDFPNTILGPSYISMTLDNIAEGKPMAVYASEGEFLSFFYITLNNLWVDIRTFASGLITCYGTITSLLYNGIMVGCFETFLYQQGVFKESFFTVFVHGTLEIATMVISGAAGLALGLGWIVPGTYSRKIAFKRSAMQGLRIFVGVVPITIIAGFIEGYITRHTEWPFFVRGLIIFLSLCFILFYYIYLPYKRNVYDKRQKKD